MKLLVPINSVEPIDAFIKAGANEFYMGFHDEDWVSEFDEYSDLNRMSSFGKSANSFSFEEALRVIALLKKRNASAFVAFNANCYTKKQIEFIEMNYFPGLEKVGVSGLVVSDYNIAASAVAHGFETVASTMCAIYNKDIARYWETVGVKRIILPRDLSLKAIGDIVQSCPSVDFEVFFMRNGCVFSDAYCLGVHHPECKAVCGFLKHGKESARFQTSFFKHHSLFNQNSKLYDKLVHRKACALCATWRFLKLGISSLKIVGRSDNWGSVLEDVRLAKENILIARSCESEEEFLSNMKPPTDAEMRCSDGLCCYYPEARFR